MWNIEENFLRSGGGGMFGGEIETSVGSMIGIWSGERRCVLLSKREEIEGCAVVLVEFISVEMFEITDDGFIMGIL